MINKFSPQESEFNPAHGYALLEKKVLYECINTV